MDNVDELNQESIKFNKHQNMQLKQYQEKTRWIQKRQMENQARIARGEKSPVNTTFGLPDFTLIFVFA